MGTEKEKIQILNQLVGMIDSQATKFKADYRKMKKVQFMAEKKFLIENIENAIQVAKGISDPQAKALGADFTKLLNEINKIQSVG